ncbi:MAG: hypothetical protein FWC72_05300 [Oscillospiraceae bacterium]|nr:hypothetical protein [Oscillospiraceae bacterium]
MTKLKRLRRRLDQMTESTYSILRGALLLTSTMALCALVLFSHSGGPTIAGFDAYKTAHELMSLAAITLLIATIVSVIIEEVTMKK